jgi:hypothetical protein
VTARSTGNWLLELVMGYITLGTSLFGKMCIPRVQITDNHSQ